MFTRTSNGTVAQIPLPAPSPADVTRLAHRMAIRVQPCTTRAYSPQSNGMAEAFVKTFKRDYVYNHDCDTPATVLALLPAWFEDYEQAPHSALAYQSPSEYLANQIS